MIFDYQPDSAFGELFTAWECEPGASADGHAREIIEGPAEGFLVLSVGRDPDCEKGPGDARFVGPPHLVTRASDAMWSRPSAIPRPGGVRGGRASWANPPGRP